MKTLLVVILGIIGILNCPDKLLAQCVWQQYHFNNFENTNINPAVVPSTCLPISYTPTKDGAYNGNTGVYLNIVNGLTPGTLIYDQPYTVCPFQTYRFSAFMCTRYNGIQCDMVIDVVDANNNILCRFSGLIPYLSVSGWTAWTSNTFTPTTDSIRFQVRNNVPGGVGNDFAFDDLLLELCNNTPNKDVDACTNASPFNLYDSLPVLAGPHGSWTGPSTLNNQSLGTFNPSSMSTGKYTYTIKNSSNCPDFIQTINVSLRPEPVVNLGNDTNLCQDEVLVLDAQTPNATYLWQDQSTKADFLVYQAGTYWVEASVNHCKSKDTINITYDPVPKINLGSDTIVCYGDILTLNATLPNASYRWQDNSTDSFYRVSKPGIYWVEVSVGNCSSIDSIQVSYAPQPMFSLLGNDTSLCQNEVLVLDATIPNATYLWQDQSTKPDFLVYQAGTYSVWALVGNCYFIDTINITYDSVPKINLGRDTFLCHGDILTLNATLPNASYRWQDNSSDSTYLVTKPGLYWVETSTDQCSSIDSIQVSFAPSQKINLGNDTSLCLNEVLVLDATIPNATYLWQDQSTKPDFLVYQAGTYSVEAAINNCKSQDTIHITYDSVPKINLGKDTNLCNGDPLILDATFPKASYRWQDNSTDSFYRVSTPGIYWVEVSVGNCSSIDSIQVSYAPFPKINLGNDTSLCQNEVLVLDATIPNATYLWQDQSTKPALLVYQPGTYWVEAAINNCKSQDTIHITYNPIPKIDLGKDTNLCNGDPLILDATFPKASYRWQDNSSDSTYLATKPGLYWVETSIDRCNSRDSIQVNFLPYPQINLGNDTNLCDNNLLSLDATTLNAKYCWQDSSSKPVLLARQSGIYWVEVSLNNCKTRDSIIITYHPFPHINLGNDTTLCQGESINLNATKPKAQYRWQDYSTDSIYLVESPGNYWVEVSTGICNNKDSITINYLSNPEVDLGKDDSLCIGDLILLEANNPNSHFLWQDYSTGSSLLVEESGLYWLEAENECGSHRDSITLVFDDCNCYVYIPTAFSPNYDGLNDQFGPIISDCEYTDFLFIIYNRWGEKVFETTNPYEFWDGNYKGRMAPLDVYAYIIQLKPSQKGKTKIQKQGNVTLVR